MALFTVLWEAKEDCGVDTAATSNPTKIKTLEFNATKLFNLPPFLHYSYCYDKQITDAVSRCFRANNHFQMKA